MNFVKLPELLDTYIKAQNAYDADAALTCFASDGSPVNLDYHFKIKNNLIEDLYVAQP